MDLSAPPKFAGIAHPAFSFTASGDANEAIVVGAAVTTADGVGFDLLTAAPAVSVVPGIASFDQKFEEDGYVATDGLSVVIAGIVSAKAAGVIAMGDYLIGAALGKVTPAGVATRSIGMALTDAAADGDIIWMLVMPFAEAL